MDSVLLFTESGVPFIVDDEDCDVVIGSEFRWSEKPRSCGNYIRRFVKSNKEYEIEYLHHFVYKRPGRGMHIDHINGDPSDNRKCNLQELSPGDNVAKQKQQSSNTGVRGVYKQKKSIGYRACIRVENVLHYLGSFVTIGEASDAYQEAKKNMRGNYGN
jgi:hypothetical protein